jgi:malonyl-CoA/methylmalonyl-CoA synthetase
VDEHATGGDDLSNDLLAERTLPAAWSARRRTAPDAPALGDRHRGWLTNGDLERATVSVAIELGRRGLAPGDRVIISGATGVDLVVVHVAALRAGLVVVPVNPTFTRLEFLQTLAAARPTAVLADGDLPAWGADADAGLATVDSLTALVDGVGAAGPDARPEVALDQVRPTDVALLAFTSGTTGQPKGVPLTHANLLAGAEALRRAWAWTPHDRLILALPLFHMHGLGVGVHGSLLAGASMWIVEQFDPETILQAAAQPEATMFFGVPTMYSRLVDAPGVERLGRLRLCISGSAPLSADLHARVRDRAGQVVLERYGMTETVMLTSNPLDGDRRPGTVGLPLPGVDLRLDPQTDEIQVRGPNVFGGYLDRPGANSLDPNAGAFTTDGWFRTGDVGRVDDGGYVTIVGRAKDLIITGGYNVYPPEIEAVLRACPGVADAAVAGLASTEWGETVAAWIEVATDADPTLVIDALGPWCEGRLAAYKRPRQVRVVDALPRNALGKIQRQQLRG